MQHIYILHMCVYIYTNIYPMLVLLKGNLHASIVTKSFLQHQPLERMPFNFMGNLLRSANTFNQRSALSACETTTPHGESSSTCVTGKMDAGIVFMELVSCDHPSSSPPTAREAPACSTASLWPHQTNECSASTYSITSAYLASPLCWCRGICVVAS